MVIMTDDAGFMGDVILGKMSNANEIHFNLDGFSEERYRQFLNDRSSVCLVTNKLSFWDKDTNNITNWEYHQIISNNDLFNKTIFYDQGGTIRPRDQVYRPN